MKALLLLLLLATLFSCAPKVERACPPAREVALKYRERYVPSNFRIYGLLEYGPLKFPMMLAKYDNFYTVKVARAGDVEMKRDRVCVRGKCYLLPAPPEDLIFGRLLNGREYSFCRGKTLYFRDRGRVYERIVSFLNGKPLEVSLINLRTNRSVRVLLKKEDKRGFFREIIFIFEGTEVKLIVEEVET